MSLSIHLHFNGQCEQAFLFYKTHLNGKIGTLLKYKDSPSSDQVPSDWQEKVIHANISLYNVELAGADVLPQEYAPPKGFSLLLGLASPKEVSSLFEKLSKDGTITLAPQKTFWSPCYAMVTDCFGVSWELNCAS